MSDYNGWTNYETWNVALWLSNDEALYLVAREAANYLDLVHALNTSGSDHTPDGVRWDDEHLDVPALEDLLTQLKEG